MTTKDILIEARKLVEKGWCQYTLLDGDKVCASHAIYCAAGPGDDYTGRAFVAVRKSLGLWPFGTLTAWNDTPGRTQAEVLAAFDKAIAEA